MALKEEELQAKLKELTAEIVSDLSALDAAHSKELLGDFVSDLFVALASSGAGKSAARNRRRASPPPKPRASASAGPPSACPKTLTSFTGPGAAER